MSNKERIELRAPGNLKARYQRLMDSRGTTITSEFLRFMASELEAAGEFVAPESGDEPDETKRRWRVANTRLSETEWDQMMALIEDEQGKNVSTWLLRAVRERITQGPILRDAELLAVQQSTYQLRSIGRNLNQMVRAVNEGKADRGHFSEHYADQLKQRIEAVTGSTEALLRAATDRGLRAEVHASTEDQDGG
ncbi:MAG: plasmid mobilization relaxosome protein MobC [Pseudomonadales bacterium]|nr:plasmid mobilization relaxosome protein MobC [Pseudomonadales bacterium]